MTMKRGLTKKLVLTILLIAAIALSMAAPAFAADYSSGKNSEEPAQAAITKIFKMPVGTPTPEAEFVFTFTKSGMNVPLDDSSEALAGMPEIPNVTISFTAGEEPEEGTFVTGDTKTVVKESKNFLADITPAMWVNGEGIYKYTVEETTGGITLADALKEETVYSAARYDVEIWVEKDVNDVLYPKYVSVKIIQDHVDEYYEGTLGSEKVDPTPGGVNQVEGEKTIEDDFSQFIFTNKYSRSDGGGVTDPSKSALDIEKIITGNGAELDAYFDFDIKVTKPSIVSDPQTYKAYVVDQNGNNVTGPENYATLGTDANGSFILFTSGNELTGVKLTNGQKLAFVDLHIGSAVEVLESASAGYIPSYQRTFAGEAQYKGSVNTEFGFPRASQDEGPHYTQAGANTNQVTFTNTRSGATPTGISVDNLPFIVLIGLATAGLVILTIIKIRKNTNHTV